MARRAGAAHQQWRRAVLNRDGYRCQRCGLVDVTGRQLEADHLDERTYSLAVRDGQTLCIDCHRIVTAARARRPAAGS